MTDRDDITRMAQEAGFRFSDEEGPLIANHAEWQRQLFERFAALIAAAERKRLCDAAERCRMCEQKGVRHEQTKGDETD
jgi:hypothetical protein